MAEIAEEIIYGERWRVLPRLVEPEVALRAGQQALWLASDKGRGRWIWDQEEWGEGSKCPGFQITKVDCNPLRLSNVIEAPLVAPRIPDLRLVVAAGQRHLTKPRGMFFINILPGAALLPKHTDKDPVDLVAVRLSHPVEAAFGEEGPFEIPVGGAFWLHNPDSEAARVPHSVLNLSPTELGVSVAVI